MKLLNIKWTGLSLVLGLAVLTVPATASSRHTKKKHTSTHSRHASMKRAKSSFSHSGVETTLVGINIFDSGMRVLDVYGSPDSIEPANAVSVTPVAGAAGAPGGAPGGFSGGFPGPGSGAGGFGGRAGRKEGGGGAPGGAGASQDTVSPFSFGDDMLKLNLQGGPGPTGPGGNNFGGGARNPGAGGFPGGPGFSNGAGFPGGAGRPGAGGGAAPSSGGAVADNVTYTRWVYNRPASKYGFVLDKFNRVVQIEVIGLGDSKVHTKRGIVFGSNFASIIRAYGTPDAYDLAGDNLTLRYLSKAKVAFKMTRLELKKPHAVTGIVVAAAKG